MSRLTRRALTFGLAALPLPALAQAPALSAADRALVDRAAAYLQGLTEAKAQFVQTDARGGVSRGTLYLRRPGKARFAYDPPSRLLVVADGNYVSVLDPRLKSFDRYALMSTPLAIFLAREIKLDRGVAVTRVSRAANGFTITARDGKKPGDGSIALFFSDAPIALQGWTVTDARGGATNIRLSGLTPAPGLDPALFVLKDPRMANPGRARM